MVAPVAVAAGKRAADNPAGTVFLAVLAGAVLLQGVKNLPNFGEWAWNKAIPFDVTAPFDKTMEAIETTAALNDEVLAGFDQISENNQDPLETFIFGEDLSLEVYEPGEISGLQTAYRGARKGLFAGAWARGGSLY
jgi:hypothetical protein